MHAFVIRLIGSAASPPLTITREELDEGLEIFDEVLAIADEYSSA
jgi:4-aminobutyrate aminotransferase-like enzyme